MTKERNVSLRSALLIGLSFMWTGSTYLNWLYRLIPLTSATTADLLSEVVGYLFQALGLALFALFVKRNREAHLRGRIFHYVIAIDIMCYMLIGFVSNFSLVLGLGLFMNLLHGLVAGFYLINLVVTVPQQKRGFSFGLGYAIGTLGSWMLSLLPATKTANPVQYLVFILLVFATIPLFHNTSMKENLLLLPEDDASPAYSLDFILLCGLAVLLLSAAKSIGFYFPMNDVASQSVSLEFTRLYYGLGLLIASVINDKNRKYGAIGCLAVLVFPFLLLFLSGNRVSAILLWVIAYFFTGFYAVYRIVLFGDLAGKGRNMIYLAGFGLMFGRVGDAVGSAIGMALGGYQILLVFIGAALFAFSVVLVMMLFQKLYVQPVERVVVKEVMVPVEKTASDSSVVSKETAKNFSQTSHKLQNLDLDKLCKEYEISKREAEVLRLMLMDYGNAQISEQLFISENTVKFHVKNILKKTGCANRKELVQKLDL